MKVCFIGHRKIDEHKVVKEKLYSVVKTLIDNYFVDTFIFGSKSDFNTLCHIVVTSLMPKHNIKRIFYTSKSEFCVLEKERELLQKQFREISKVESEFMGFEEEYEHSKKYSAGKAGYVERNFAMIDDSDICVFYYNENYSPNLRQYAKRCLTLYRPTSGTRLAYEYACRKKKTVINIFKMI